MRRRQFITLLGGAAAAWPRAGRAQQRRLPVIGVLNAASVSEYAHVVATFRQGLSHTGYVDGRNVVFEYRWADNQYERLPMLAADLVDRQVNVIAAGGGTASALAARAATSTIPIVFSIASDPVAVGLVASLNRPGGNITGATTLGAEVGPKRLELIHELVPSATDIGLLINPTTPNAPTQLRDARSASQAIGIQLHILHASKDADFEAVFATLDCIKAGGLVIGPDTFFNTRSEQLAALALRHKIPAVYLYRAFAAAGGLMSYGSSQEDLYLLAGTYTGRILKGDKPADLPVQQATKVELVINMKTAKTLGLTFPITLLGRADEVIE